MSTTKTSHGAAAGHGGQRATTLPGTQSVVPGVSSAQGGYLLSPVTAPAAVEKAGTLSLQILDANGEAITRFVASHERKLHLIVVRTDGTQFRHVHPIMDTDGTWSLPWDWAEAGTYRVYADFVPAKDAAGETVTLTRTVEVAGQFAPSPTEPSATALVGGFTVELTGGVVPGTTSQLSFQVFKNAKPVTSLQPYLGAFGHLVALREGDLAYLHVHPEGEEPAAGELSGPEIEFAAEAPTPGRYLLYLDFQVDGQIHTAPFVVDTAGTVITQGAPSDSYRGDAETARAAGMVVGSGVEFGDGHIH
jgi:hypothetical protein